MESISSIHPLQLLKDLEQACKKQASDPLLTTTALWSGLGFRIANYKVCIASKYIDEVLDSNFKNNLSNVPGAKKWLSGLISLRGQALPVIDLNQYLFGKKTEYSKKNRLLVIKFSNMNTGLIIDETFGLLQSNQKQPDQTSKLNHQKLSSAPEDILKYSGKTRNIDNQLWIEFSISKLENDSNFLSATRF